MSRLECSLALLSDCPVAITSDLRVDFVSCTRRCVKYDRKAESAHTTYMTNLYRVPCSSVENLVELPDVTYTWRTNYYKLS